MEETYETVIINPAFGKIETLRTNLLSHVFHLEFDSVKVIVDQNPGVEGHPPLQLTKKCFMKRNLQKVWRNSIDAITEDFDEALQAICDMSKKYFNGEYIKIKVERIDLKCAKDKVKFRFELAQDDGEWSVTLTKIHHKGRWRLVENMSRNNFERYAKYVEDIVMVSCEITKSNKKKFCKSQQMLKNQLADIGLNINDIDYS